MSTVSSKGDAKVQTQGCPGPKPEHTVWEALGLLGKISDSSCPHGSLYYPEPSRAAGTCRLAWLLFRLDCFLDYVHGLEIKMALQ